LNTIRVAAATSSGVAALVAALLLATTVSASGGGSIATAPELPLGQVVAGGGQKADFWRVQLFAGDRLTFKASFPGDEFDAPEYYEFSLYAPVIEDFSYANASSVANNPESDVYGLTEFAFTSPFTGLGTLVVCEGDYREQGCSGQIYPTDPMDAYTFTAAIAHATNLAISTPAIARRRSTITVRATISSPAGVPQGNCLIQNQLVPLKDGHCSQRLRLGRGRKQTVGVSFVPEDGWLGAEGHRSVRLVA
jgi:hypothetical protein